VLSAVHHAEVVAHRVGEPFGTLVLAVAVTVIEVALIVSLMLAGGPETTALARDTVFAAVMIILTGIVGLCLLLGGARFREQSFGLHGVSASLATLAAIVVLTLILPNYTTTDPGPAFAPSQLVFIAVVSLILYGTFVFAQIIRHRDYFLPVDAAGNEEVHARPRHAKWPRCSGFLLDRLPRPSWSCLAKALARASSRCRRNRCAHALVGVIIAAVVLFPEGARRGARGAGQPAADKPQSRAGSALASIGLTIPDRRHRVVGTGVTLTLGIDIKSTVLLLCRCS
jgi:Ca2+:H+ antiporter